MIIRYLLVIIPLALQFANIAESRTPRIVGGSQAGVGEIPYIVKVQQNGTFHCGGSLLTPKCVLTAAHCIYNLQPADISVQGGVTLSGDQRKRVPVKNMFISPFYQVKTMDHDLALLELSNPMQGHYIQTIELSNKTLKVGDMIRVSGWGHVRENGAISQHLRTVYLRVLSHRECNNLYRNYRKVTPSMFCASIPGLRDACLGDSGGPAVLDNQLIGIVSWGRRNQCARFNSPGVYVNLKNTKSWLNNVLSNYCH